VLNEGGTTAMLTVLVWSIAVLAVPVLTAATMLVLELLAAQLPARREAVDVSPRPSCAVLIPAHNEEPGICPTLASILPQLAPGDRVLVVADNCTDATAAVARAAGAEVVERADTSRRGKGYALDFGVRTLEKATPAVVVVIDADCTLEPGSLDGLVRKSAASGRPVQAAYVMEAPHGGGTRSQLAAFLFALKNVIRPRGLSRLGLPCLLTGTGMAFPWELLHNAPIASGNIVEDMQLGIDLALAGRPPMFCATAQVRSELPATSRAAASQRTRWIHGHLTTLTTQAPRLLATAVRRGRPALLGLALEVSVPPLSLLVLAGLLALALLTVGALFGGPALPAVIAASAGVLTASALLFTWARFGRVYLPAAGLLAIPGELASRLSILSRFVTRPQGTWVRTERRASS
jgi:cellulose synthase/poly-beta-1,6-N-acetylglucosamine synthase-like glycosyltransferase